MLRRNFISYLVRKKDQKIIFLCLILEPIVFGFLDITATRSAVDFFYALSETLVANYIRLFSTLSNRAIAIEASSRTTSFSSKHSAISLSAFTSIAFMACR